jgi:hypothetical protein
MSEFSAISAFPAVSVAAGAASQAAPVATGGPAFGAVLRESLAPGAGQQASTQDAGRAFVAMPPATAVAMGAAPLQQTATAVLAGTSSSTAANGVTSLQAAPTRSTAQTNSVAAEQTRQSPAETISGSAAMIAAAAAPALAMPVQQASVAASQVATEGVKQAAPQTASQVSAFGLPAGFTGTMTYMADGGRAVFGAPSLVQGPALFTPMPSAQPNPSLALDLTPGPLTAAQTASMTSAPAVTWTRGLPSIELPRLEIGVEIAPPPTIFTATQMTPMPVTETPLTEESEMVEEPEDLEEGETIAPGFDALSNASAEVGLPGDLINGLHTTDDVISEPALIPDGVQVDGITARKSADSAVSTRQRSRTGTDAVSGENVGSGEAGQAARFDIDAETDSEADPADAAETNTALPRAASAATASAYETASVAAAGRAADVTAASARPDAEVVLRETARTSQPRTLAGVQAAQAAASSAPASGRIVDQVANGLSLAVRDGRTEAVLTLRPDALGEVRVQIVSGPEGVTIRLSAEREAVGELLRAGIADLQEALAGHQVAVSEVVVMQNAPAQAATNAETPLWQERPWSRQEPEAEDGEQPERGQPQDEQDEE